MYIREQLNRIYCIRTYFDPISACYRQKVAASFVYCAEEVPAVVMSKLTTTEQQQLSTWFETWKAAKAEKLRQHLVENTASNLRQLCETFKATPMTESQAASIWKAWRDFSKVLRQTVHQPQSKSPQTRDLPFNQ